MQKKFRPYHGTSNVGQPMSKKDLGILRWRSIRMTIHGVSRRNIIGRLWLITITSATTAPSLTRASQQQQTYKTTP
ncbi:hypothetical protein EMPG_14789 [Blastomyces silverae]|uniref:Uncharacterized protein n=1 Tax=Blastomyces silverae TaxID=2060906 RepID=A0A0H1BF75_9EURO|nr:hypothetical protein EMPG_14789 [Blastomyces silverae]